VLWNVPEDPVVSHTAGWQGFVSPGQTVS